MIPAAITTAEPIAAHFLILRTSRVFLYTFLPYHLASLIPKLYNSFIITLVITSDVKIDTILPTARVVAKPLTGPVPNMYNTKAAISVVTLPSTIDDVALLYPERIAFSTDFPAPISSLILV